MSILTRVRKLFRKAQEAIDWLNKVINESILGAALIRVLNAQDTESAKFEAANARAKDIGMGILKLFAMLIPVVIFSASLASLAILGIGGHLVISGSMSLGDFTAFNAYLAILIFPIIVIGFMSNVIAQATASYGRIAAVLDAPPARAAGTHAAALKGDISVSGLCIRYGEKPVLRDVSFAAAAGSRTAIIGPTAAGKTQLLYAMTGLIRPDSGQVRFDGTLVEDWDRAALHAQTGFVFQDSSLFNLTLRENIAFSATVSGSDLEKAIETAELGAFVRSLPQGWTRWCPSAGCRSPAGRSSASCWRGRWR